MKQYKFYDLMDDLPTEVQMAVREARKPFGAEAAKRWGLCEASEAYEIDITQVYPEPRFTVRLNGVGTLPMGDIQAVKAKSKNGKSFLCSVFVASVLGCEDFQFKAVEDGAKVLYFDTEQNERNTAALAKRVYSLMKWSTERNNERFKAYSLRSAAISERLPIIERAIRENAPTMAVIDGIADLLEDFNDVGQSSEIINYLMRLSAENDVAIVNVLHTNKRKDDSDMKGHLGTLLLQKASDVFEVKKNDGIFNVTESDCRNVSIPDFSFSIGADGVPIWSPDIKATKVEEELMDVMAKMNTIFGGVPDGFTYKELTEKYMMEAAVSERTAKNKIRFAKDSNIIKVMGKQYVLVDDTI